MKKLMIYLAACLLVMNGCSPANITPGEGDTDFVKLSSDLIEFGPDGGQMSITVESSGTWYISGNSDWVEPSVLQGQSGDAVEFSADRNSGSDPLCAEFKIFSGNATARLTINSGTGYYMEILPESVENLCSAGAGILKIKLRTNIPESDMTCVISPDASSWLQYTGRQDIFGISTLSFSVTENTLYVDRSAEITISGQNCNSDISVVQSKPDVFRILNEIPDFDLASRDYVLKIESNLPYNVYSDSPWLSIAGISEPSDLDGDGLAANEVTLHIEESSLVRNGILSFKTGERLLSSVTIAQKDPNARQASISDPALRDFLYSLKWIMSTEVPSDVAEAGMTATELDITPRISLVDGLGAFPELQNLILTDQEQLPKVDLSDCKTLSNIIFDRTYMIEEILLGASPVSEVVLNQDYFFSTAGLTVSGDNVETINISAPEGVFVMDNCPWVDVSGCPELSYLNISREGVDGSMSEIRTIYLSAEQEAAWRSGTLEIQMSSGINISVR